MRRHLRAGIIFNARTQGQQQKGAALLSAVFDSDSFISNRPMKNKSYWKVERRGFYRFRRYHNSRNRIVFCCCVEDEERVEEITLMIFFVYSLLLFRFQFSVDKLYK